MSIPWSKPKLDKKDKYHLDKAFLSSWISGGPYVTKFQEKFKKVLNRKYTFATSNGTSAIHLALLSLNLKSKDEIIIPAFGYLAAANISKMMGLNVIFSDVDKKSYCISLDEIKSKISKKTKVVIIINTYGNMCEIDRIEKYLKKKKIVLIEDAAESLGSRYKKKRSGEVGDISTFSFHATKNITTGEGGMVLTNNKKYAKKIELFRNHGVDKERYKHLVHGYNFRLSNLLASIGYSQSLKISNINKKKKLIYNLYLKYLDLKHIKTQDFDTNTSIVPWTVAITLKKNSMRDKLHNYLTKKGIETRKGFYSVDRLKLFKIKKKFVNSNYLSKNIICLPLHLNLTKKKIKLICHNVNKFIIR